MTSYCANTQLDIADVTSKVYVKNYKETNVIWIYFQGPNTQDYKVSYIYSKTGSVLDCDFYKLFIHSRTINPGH